MFDVGGRLGVVRDSGGGVSTWVPGMLSWLLVGLMWLILSAFWPMVHLLGPLTAVTLSLLPSDFPFSPISLILFLLTNPRPSCLHSGSQHFLLLSMLSIHHHNVMCCWLVCMCICGH
ncbi:hypothetical protein PAXRUDRAFT_793983 [Paxillus rubicundulus Ve08.2h10]|uniref:Uncharacterized protein n=1 Tax=Paxillus rubicundulus Ve08.2h10 TaxID=930991 RepID=A0A0D0D619_9AGAM|nr:hypothetical protein PAXRUDRAFT_793983 [Paxillus rubicundulus Ve08.2h10]